MEVENGPLGDKTKLIFRLAPVSTEPGPCGEGLFISFNDKCELIFMEFHRLVLDIPSFLISTTKTPKFTAKSHLPEGKGSSEPTPSVSGAIC